MVSFCFVVGVAVWVIDDVINDIKYGLIYDMCEELTASLLFPFEQVAEKQMKSLLQLQKIKSSSTYIYSVCIYIYIYIYQDK